MHFLLDKRLVSSTLEPAAEGFRFALDLCLASNLRQIRLGSLNLLLRLLLLCLLLRHQFLLAFLKNAEIAKFVQRYFLKRNDVIPYIRWILGRPLRCFGNLPSILHQVSLFCEVSFLQTTLERLHEQTSFHLRVSHLLSGMSQQHVVGHLLSILVLVVIDIVIQFGNLRKLLPECFGQSLRRRLVVFGIRELRGVHLAVIPPVRGLGHEAVCVRSILLV